MNAQYDAAVNQASAALHAIKVGIRQHFYLIKARDTGARGIQALTRASLAIRQSTQRILAHAEAYLWACRLIHNMQVLLFEKLVSAKPVLDVMVHGIDAHAVVRLEMERFKGNVDPPVDPSGAILWYSDETYV
jgi:hypothetical protein